MGGKNTSTQSTNSAPWSEAQPLLKTGLDDANTLYKSGVGGQTYMGSTVIPFSQQSTTGMNAIENQANANLGGSGLSGQSQDIINSGGFNAPQQDSIQYLSGAGTNPFDLSQNSAYQSYKSNALDDIQDRVNASASAAGRFGSFKHGDALVDSLSNAGNAMDMQQFGRMDNLNSQRFNAGQQGIGNLSNAYQIGQMPAQSMMDIGGMYEDLAGRVKNDELRIFDSIQNKPWEQLGRLNAVASGSGQYGTSQTTSTQPGQNPFMTGLGALSLGASLF